MQHADIAFKRIIKVRIWVQDDRIRDVTFVFAGDAETTRVNQSCSCPEQDPFDLADGEQLSA